MDTWECMSQECREVAVQLPYKEIRATLDTYLKRHKFCSDCSKMVNKAYNLLVEDIQVGDGIKVGSLVSRFFKPPSVYNLFLQAFQLHLLSKLLCGIVSQ